MVVSGNTSLENTVLTTVSAGTVRSNNLWINGSVLNANDGTRSSLILPGDNTVWSTDLNYNFNVNGLLATGVVSAGSIGAPGITAGTLYATAITSANVAALNASIGNIQLSGTISANNNTNASIILSDSGIRFRNNDDNHGLQFNLALDGPRMWGFEGGAVGYGGINGSNALTWNSSGITVNGNVSSGSIGAAGATIGTLYANTITASNLYVSGSVVSVNVTTLNLVDNVISSGTLVVSGNTSLGNTVLTTVSAGTVRSNNLWINGSVLNANDGTRSSLILPGDNTVWSTDLNYNFNVNGLLATGVVSAGSIGAPGITAGTLYATAITSANAQVSGTVSAGTLATPLITSSSLGVAGATVGTLYSNGISMNYTSIDTGRMVGAKNQTAANITGFNFSSSYDSFLAYLTIRMPGACEIITLIGFKTPVSNEWRMDQVSSGDYTQVPVEITTSGQLIYSAPDAGVAGPTFSWYALRNIA